MVFDSNRDHPSGYSGAIYLSAFGQIMLEKLVDIHFMNNTGRYIAVDQKFPITIILYTTKGRLAIWPVYTLDAIKLNIIFDVAMCTVYL